MKTVKVNDSIYRFSDVLSTSEYINLFDEFTFYYNNLTVKSGDGTDNEYPRLSIKKPDSKLKVYSETPSLGDNFVFINLSTKLKLIAEHTLKKRLRLIRINTNIQFAGQDSNFHKDGGVGYWTFCLFNQLGWDSEWGGEFVCCIDRDYHYVPYIPNNACLFAAHNEHKGSPPSIQCTSYRTSIACTFMEL